MGKEKKKKGVIYLLWDNINESYKIGMTKGNAEKRLKQLQTGNTTELVLLKTFETDYPYMLESALHRRYSHCKVINEWYALSQEELDGFTNTCQVFNDAIIAVQTEE